MPWPLSSSRSSHPSTDGRSPSPNPKTTLPSSPGKLWLITPLGAPSHCSGSAVPNHRGVPRAPRRGAGRGSSEGAKCLSLVVGQSGASVTSIQEGPQHASGLFGEDRPGLAGCRRSQGRSCDLVLDRAAQRIRETAVEVVGYGPRRQSKALPDLPRHHLAVAALTSASFLEGSPA